MNVYLLGGSKNIGYYAALRLLSTHRAPVPPRSRECVS